MNLYVVRHGQTNWNVQGILQGSSDVKLNDMGIIQATELSKILNDINFSLIFCSPLSRAIQTAKIINAKHSTPIIINNKLTERNYGDLEGTSPQNIFKYWDYFLNIDDNNVEPIKSFLNRIFDFLDELKRDYINENILLVTHSGVMVGIDCYINGFKDNYDLINYKFDNGTYKKYTI